MPCFPLFLTVTNRWSTSHEENGMGLSLADGWTEACSEMAGDPDFGVAVPLTRVSVSQDCFWLKPRLHDTTLLYIT